MKPARQLLIAAAFWGACSFTFAQQLLEPDQAFVANVIAVNRNQLVLDLTPAPGYYLYRDRVRVTATPVKIDAVRLPMGDIKSDGNFGKVEVYHQVAKIVIDLAKTPAAKKITVVATYQGCNEPVGVCYAPIEKTFEVAMP